VLRVWTGLSMKTKQTRHLLGANTTASWEGKENMARVLVEDR